MDREKDMYIRWGNEYVTSNVVPNNSDVKNIFIMRE